MDKIVLWSSLQVIIYWEGTDGNSKEFTVNLSYAMF